MRTKVCYSFSMFRVDLYLPTYPAHTKIRFFDKNQFWLPVNQFYVSSHFGSKENINLETIEDVETYFLQEF